ncbi:hypothetical protein NG752_04055 [Aliarcobacter cryaerophilus]|uniref:hypothetical protein n=1 Tax=Aliarcobacter cryaerophilus TaxID=28198 RepID=UPI003DA5D11D
MGLITKEYRTYNRLPHILNRNILLKEKKFSTHEIKKCLSQNKYSALTPRGKVLVSKLLNEIEDNEDLEAIINAYNLNLKDIEDIYKSSPYSTCGFTFWDNKFNIKIDKEPKKPYIPLKSSQIKSPKLKKLVKNIECLEAVCWDYDINANDVYTILKTKKDDDFPISFDVLRKKVLKYISIDNLQKIFTLEELKDIFSGINPKIIRNPETRDFYLREIELYLHDPKDFTFNCFWQTPFPAKQTVTSIIRNYLATMNKQDIHTLCKKFGKDRVLKELNDKYKELFEVGFFDFKGMKIPLNGDYKDYGTYKEILEILKEYKCK